jgi:ssDNA-binding Zn-finger/Zn-ribbon topoisomerase 1
MGAPTGSFPTNSPRAVARAADGVVIDQTPHGVVGDFAYCPECDAKLEHDGSELSCPKCGWQAADEHLRRYEQSHGYESGRKHP